MKLVQLVKVGVMSGLIVLSIDAYTAGKEKVIKSKNKKEKTEMKQDKEIKTTSSGLQYIIHEKGTGEQAKAGDLVSVHYKGYFTNGEVFDSSFDRGEPIEFELGKGQVIAGWDELIQLLHVGDSATALIPSALAYGKDGVGPIPGNTDLNFDVKLVGVKELKMPEKFNIDGIEPIVTESGLKLYIIEKGNGKKPATITKGLIDYSGYLEDGTMFDSSIMRGKPLYIPVGAGMVIRGWDEGLQLVEEGSKFRLVIPAELGYGDKEVGGVIPANSTLIFDMHVLEFRNPEDKKAE